MRDETVLIELKEKLGNIKSDISTKEGERNAIFGRIKKEFGMEDVDAMYVRLKEIDGQVEVKQEKRQSLLKIAQERLEGYE